MAERFPGDGAAANGFGRRWLHEWEARLLQEANYPTPPDMHVPGAWRLSAGGVPVPPPPSDDALPAEIEAIRAAMPEDARADPRWAADNHALWIGYFRQRHAEQLRSTNGGPPPRGRQNSEGRRQWWGVPGRTLAAVLAHIEGGNEPGLEYPAPSFSRRRGSSWLPRRMDPPSSSSSASRSSGSAPPPLVPVKPEPQETPLRRRTRGGSLVINEGRRSPSPPRGNIRLVKPKKEKELKKKAPATVKAEHEAMAADLESALAWSREEYVAEEMERQRRALEEIAARRRGRDEGGVVVLDDSDEEVTAPRKPFRGGDTGQGCSYAAPKDEPPSDDDDDGGANYTNLYSLLGMN